MKILLPAPFSPNKQSFRVSGPNPPRTKKMAKNGKKSPPQVFLDGLCMSVFDSHAPIFLPKIFSCCWASSAIDVTTQLHQTEG